MAKATFTEAAVVLNGIVLQPSRLEEGSMDDDGRRVNWRFFITDVVQADERGTRIVPVRSEHVLFERVDSPQPFSAEVVLELRRFEGTASVRCTLVESRSPNGAKPAAPAQRS